MLRFSLGLLCIAAATKRRASESLEEVHLTEGSQRFVSISSAAAVFKENATSNFCCVKLSDEAYNAKVEELRAECIAAYVNIYSRAKAEEQEAHWLGMKNSYLTYNLLQHNDLERCKHFRNEHCKCRQTQRLICTEDPCCSRIECDVVPAPKKNCRVQPAKEGAVVASGGPPSGSQQPANASAVGEHRGNDRAGIQQAGNGRLSSDGTEGNPAAKQSAGTDHSGSVA
mmetsp:Transcript_156563/g.276506  ORF Transcript_156563/g.276506 Transcript_156563/m.276506 type:complete len:227 (+) Transcript_156563:81-761(+)